jgi:hypothetical protein
MEIKIEIRWWMILAPIVAAIAGYTTGILMYR